MSNVTIFVGLDYHQSGVQVCILNHAGKVLVNRKCRDDWQTIEALVAPYGNCVHAAIEACNGAANLADQLVEKAGWCISLAHPGYVARIKQSPDKTDFGDARLLADLIRVGYLPKVWHAPERIRELRRLVRYRQQWASRRRNTKLRIRALLRDHRVKISECNAWTKAWILYVRETDELSGESRWIMDRLLDDLEYVVRRIQEAEARLTQAIIGDGLIEKLLETPGVGLITAVTVRAEVGRFDRFRNGKQLSRFCGLSPRNASSGQRQADAGIIKAGNPELRRVLTQSAHRLIRHENRWERMAIQLSQRGKPTPVIVAAVANRWMRTLYHQMVTYGLGYESRN
jgi:transposase